MTRQLSDLHKDIDTIFAATASEDVKLKDMLINEIRLQHLPGNAEAEFLLTKTYSREELMNGGIDYTKVDIIFCDRRLDKKYDVKTADGYVSVENGKNRIVIKNATNDYDEFILMSEI